MLSQNLYPLPLRRFFLRNLKRRILRSKRGFESLEAEIQRMRRGSKTSRLLRRVFEQRRLKAILGGSLAILAISASILNPQASALAALSEEVVTLSPGALAFTTEVSRRFPVDEVRVTQGYRPFHPGIDFDGQTGDPIYPIMKGRVEAVVFSRWDLGKHIIVNHGGGFKSVYAHLSKIEVSAGDEVRIDRQIGQMGATGRAFGDHLHLEIIDNGRFLNPDTLLSGL